MIYYFDTSAIVKIYHPERDSEAVRRLYDSAADQILISNLSITETFSAFHRKTRDQIIALPEFRIIMRKFFSDIRRRRFLITPLDDRHIELSMGIIERRGLRTLDALHLASALALRPLEITFVCADTDLLSAASEEGMTCWGWI